MIPESEWLPLSALQHILFCPRQCALIHIEREWQENMWTAKGRIEHERVHKGYREVRKGKKQLSGLNIMSRDMGLHGQLDVLEMHLIDGTTPDNVPGLGLKGRWALYPVEFKHGKPKQNDCDRIQVCAQAMCLEEMLEVSISTAVLFYHKTRRRFDVPLKPSLRNKTRQTAEKLHKLFSSGQTPAPEYGPKCKACSLRSVCMPQSASKRTDRYYQQLFEPQET